MITMNLMFAPKKKMTMKEIHYGTLMMSTELELLV